jgi:hypothetical protein
MQGIGRKLGLLLAAAGAAEAFVGVHVAVRPRLPASSPRSGRRPAISTLKAGLFDNIFGKDGTAAQAQEKKPEWTELKDEASGNPCEY